MRKKHILIEILPRVIWITQGVILFFTHYFTIQNLVVSKNLIALVMGILLVAVGVICVMWTFYFVTKALLGKTLVTSGPYKYIRHPIYVGIYMILIGIGVLFFDQLWFIILAMFVPLWYLNCKFEEQQMTDLHGERYTEYKKNVGMFFPRKLKH